MTGYVLQDREAVELERLGFQHEVWHPLASACC